MVLVWTNLAVADHVVAETGLKRELGKDDEYTHAFRMEDRGANSVPTTPTYNPQELRYSRHISSSSPTEQTSRRLKAAPTNAPLLYPQRGRDSLRPGTNLPFHDRSERSDPDHFVSELKRCFLRPNDEQIMGGRFRAGRQRTALKLEGDRDMTRLSMEHFAFPTSIERQIPIQQQQENSVVVHSTEDPNDAGTMDVDAAPVRTWADDDRSFLGAVEDVEMLQSRNASGKRSIGDVQSQYLRARNLTRRESRSVGVQVDERTDR